MANVNKKRIAKNVVFLYIKVLVNMVVSLYATRIVLNALGASDYGTYGVVAGAVAMLGSLNAAMAQTTQRYMSYAEGEGNLNKLKSYFNSSIIIHFLLGTIIFIFMELMFCPLFDGILNIPAERMDAAKLTYHFMVISTVFTIFTVPYDAAINAHEDLVYYSVVGIIEGLLKLGAAYVIVFVYVDKLKFYGLLLACISVIMMIVMRVYCHRHYKECSFNPRKLTDKKTVVEMGKFAGWNFIGTFSAIAGNYGTTLLMNHFFGVIVNAAKSIADQICGVVGVFSANLMKAFNPVIVKQEGGGNRENMLQISMISSRLSYYMYAFIAIPFSIEANYLLLLWLKEVPSWAVMFCQLQILRTLLEQLGLPIRMSLLAEGHIKKVNIASLLVSVMTFFILWFLYRNDYKPYWHFIISILFMVVADCAFKIYYCHRYCGLSYKVFFVDVCIPCFFCTFLAIVPCIIIVYFVNEGMSRLVINILTSIFVFSIAICLFGMKKNEKNILVAMLKAKIQR